MINTLHPDFTFVTNRFDLACDQFGLFLDKNPTTFKVVLFASHLFRASSMYGIMRCLPLSFPSSLAFMTASSVLYRASIERFCSFRFTLPSVMGAIALWVGKNALISILSKAAFLSIGALFSATLGLASLGGYLLMIYKISDQDVERYTANLKPKSCCLKKKSGL